jgi:hypothetical protein
MEWFVLTYAIGIDGFDGIVGLCAGNGNYLKGPLLI